MLEEEKQLIRISNSSKFIVENILWLLVLIKILDLAIIINPAIRILSVIKVADIISIDENEVIDRFIWLSGIIDTLEIKVISIRDDIVVHQYIFVFIIIVNDKSGRINFSIYLLIVI
jgi:hypothetical protein